MNIHDTHKQIQCPLCADPTDHHGNYSIAKIECTHCGTYYMTHYVRNLFETDPEYLKVKEPLKKALKAYEHEMPLCFVTETCKENQVEAALSYDVFEFLKLNE